MPRISGTAWISLRRTYLPMSLLLEPILGGPGDVVPDVALVAADARAERVEALAVVEPDDRDVVVEDLQRVCVILRAARQIDGRTGVGDEAIDLGIREAGVVLAGAVVRGRRDVGGRVALVDRLMRIDRRARGIHPHVDVALLARIARAVRAGEEDRRRLVLDLKVDPDRLPLVGEDLLDLLADLVAGRGGDGERRADPALRADAVAARRPAGLVEQLFRLRRV